MKRSRRSAVAVMVLALILVLGIAATALGDTIITWPFTAYMHQNSGKTTYSYVGWHIYDAPVIHVRDPYKVGTSLDLHDSEIATYTPTVNLGAVGNLTTPRATGVAMSTESAMLFLNNSHIYSFGSQQYQGPQAVYAMMGGYVSLMDCLVYGDNFAAHGLYAQLAGSINGERTTIVTDKSGQDGSAVATGFDNGGVITLHACEVHSYGTDDAAAYSSTGIISVTDTKAYAHESEGAWVNGGNGTKLDWSPFDVKYGLIMYNSSLYSYKNFGVSFAKGPLSDVASDDPAGFAMSGGYLESAKATLYAPNSKATILLFGMSNYSYDGTLLTTKWTGQGPGGGVPTKDTQTQPGSRESTVNLFAYGSQLKGDVITDVDDYTGASSTVNMYLTGWTSYQGVINKANQGAVNLYMAKESEWQVTGDSYVGVIDVPTINDSWNSGPGTYNFFTFSPDLSHVFSHGHNVYYGAFANPSIQTKTYQLPGGGLLIPALGLQSIFVLTPSK